MRALPYSRTARQRFQLDGTAASPSPDVPAAPGAAGAVTAQPAATASVPPPTHSPAPAARTAAAARAAANLPAARRVVAAINAARPPGEPSAQAGELAPLDPPPEIFPPLGEKAAGLGPPAGVGAGPG